MYLQDKIYDFSLKVKTVEQILDEDCVSKVYDLPEVESSILPLKTSEKCWLLLQRFCMSPFAVRYNGAAAAMDAFDERAFEKLRQQVRMGTLEIMKEENGPVVTQKMISDLEANEKYYNMFLSESQMSENDIADYKHSLEEHLPYNITADDTLKLVFDAQLAITEDACTTVLTENFKEDEFLNLLKNAKFAYGNLTKEYNLIKQEVDLIVMMTLASIPNYCGQDEYHERMTGILYALGTYRLVYDDFEGNLLVDYVNKIFEGPGQKTAFIKFISSLDGKYLEYAKVFWALLRMHYKEKGLTLPIDLSDVIVDSAIEEINEEEARVTRCSVVAEYACRYHHIKEEEKDVFLRIVDGRSSGRMMFGHGISKNTQKPKKTGGVRVLFVLIQYIQNPASLKEKEWRTEGQAKALFLQLGFGETDMRDTGYKLKNIDDITTGLIECEKFIMGGDSPLEKMLKQ